MGNIPFNPDADEDIRSWELPFVEAEELIDERKTNAFNRRSDWKYEPPEAEEEILPPTAEEIEAIRAAAYQEGFDEGKQAGYAEGHAEGLENGHAEGVTQGLEEGTAQGLAAGQEQIDSLTEQWQALIKELHTPVLTTNKETQKQLVTLAVALAKAVIRREVETQPEIILTALNEAVKTLPINDRSIHIRLHPDDLAIIKGAFDEDTIKQNQWHLIATPEMARGGCDVSTESNAVDHSIERRSKAVLETFLLQQGLGDV
ncbi:flagellar assembly protein FliH [Alteromonas flava]|uniref:flagellar assembly protein FliH n=1 Tax=Alteromonas flava TaxID=2048003 RepID=UPI000C2899C8|nr:flagellar assembly protein FliH [Alteromonas flava]